MSRFTRGTTVRVEFFGGPLCGKVVDRTPLAEANGFLPSVIHEDYTGVTPSVVVVYAADVVKPVTPRGTHRYVYRP